MKTCKICKKEFEYGKFTPKHERATGVCSDCLNKPFEITSICRLDLLDKFTPKQIAKFDDSNMSRLASKMADAYCNDGFWIDSEIIGNYVLER